MLSNAAAESDIESPNFIVGGTSTRAWPSFQSSLDFETLFVCARSGPKYDVQTWTQWLK
jgi:hypothetical protein